MNKSPLEIAKEALESIVENINEIPGSRLYALDTAVKALSDIEAAEKNCEHEKEMAEICKGYSPGEALLCGNGDSQRFWKLKEECEKNCGLDKRPEDMHNSQSGGDPFGAEGFDFSSHTNCRYCNKQVGKDCKCYQNMGDRAVSELLKNPAKVQYVPNPQPLYGVDIPTIEKLIKVVAALENSGYRVESKVLHTFLDALKPLDHKEEK